MRIYIDTETTGIPDMHLQHTHPAQPNLVQVAVVLVDDAWVERAVFSAIVRPEGWTIPDAAAAVHGITTVDAAQYGLPLRLVVPVLSNMLRMADEVIAHNYPFDERIINTAFHRYKEAPCPWPFKRSCTLEQAEPVLKLPATARMRAAGRANSYKKPNLAECMQYFYRRAPGKHHDALADARDCMQVHRALLEGRRKAAWYRGLW